MTENKTMKPYAKPSMVMINVEPMTILAGSGDGMYSNEWGNGGYDDTIVLEDINQ